MAKEYQLESPDAISPWGYPSLLPKYEKFSVIIIVKKD
jgi:hypothetical protein